jgi:hypothetical protein
VIGGSWHEGSVNEYVSKRIYFGDNRGNSSRNGSLFRRGMGDIAFGVVQWWLLLEMGFVMVFIDGMVVAVVADGMVVAVVVDGMVVVVVVVVVVVAAWL